MSVVLICGGRAQWRGCWGKGQGPNACTCERLWVETWGDTHRVQERKGRFDVFGHARKHCQRAMRNGCMYLKAEAPQSGQDVDAGVGEVDAEDDHGQIQIAC